MIHESKQRTRRAKVAHRAKPIPALRDPFIPSEQGPQLAFAGPVLPACLLNDRVSADRAFLAPQGGDMPRISERNLHGIAFMYRTRQEAEARVKIGGSAFLLGRLIAGSGETPVGRVYIPYLISNRHVVWEGSACVASVNRRDGKAPDIFDIDQNDWHNHPGGADVSATCMMQHFDRTVHDVTHIPEHWIVTPQLVTDYDIGMGDEAFMIGRFVNHQGQVSNRPAVRFGTISMMLERAWNNDLKSWEESFACEMRSRTGFSGSPVVTYRTPATVLTDVPKDEFHLLLGINWGYVLDENKENTWLNAVVPAWKILETLDVPALKQLHAQHTKHFYEDFLPRHSGTQSALAVDHSLIPDVSGAAETSKGSAPGGQGQRSGVKAAAVSSRAASEAPASDNPRHKEDFTNLLRAAAKGRKRARRTSKRGRGDS